MRKFCENSETVTFVDFQKTLLQRTFPAILIEIFEIFMMPRNFDKSIQIWTNKLILDPCNLTKI